MWNLNNCNCKCIHQSFTMSDISFLFSALYEASLVRYFCLSLAGKSLISSSICSSWKKSGIVFVTLYSWSLYIKTCILEYTKKDQCDTSTKYFSNYTLCTTWRPIINLLLIAVSKGNNSYQAQLNWMLVINKYQWGSNILTKDVNNRLCATHTEGHTNRQSDTLLETGIV